MEDLSMILNFMKARSSDFSGDYFIPEKWNSFGYENFKTDSARPGELNVNPYDFFCSCVNNEILNKQPKSNSAGRSEISADLIYSILPRSFTAWPHYNETDICSGTFLKTLIILPLLKKYNVSILYLLPIFSFSDHYKKGSLGSPYSIKDIYKIDKALHDPLLGDYSEELLEIEFKAFVEVCHTLGIKVIVDFAFRTVARDNVLIAKHPDWFYWIKSEFNDDFRPPILGRGEKSLYLSDKTIKQLYKSKNIGDYLSQFTLPPNQIDGSKWELVKSQDIECIDHNIEQEFAVTTVPGFSDVINDHQPAWTDVTYLRFYFDNPPQIQEYIKKNQPPYIMQDGASLDKYHGKEKNKELWEYVIGVLPFYKKIYNIDGARIDMAHALPAELNALIIEKIREIDEQFILWSEELNPTKGAQARQNGFDFISGYTYFDYKKVGQAVFNKAIFAETFLKSELPLAASLETPDTPRAAYIHKNPELLKLLFILNSFMPNSVPMINSGQQLLETQPMNLGLDNDESGRFVLPTSDPMYGKLAFFDMYCLHWLNDCNWLNDVFHDIAEIRKNYLSLVADRDNFILQPELFHNKKLTTLCYYDKIKDCGLFVAANRSENSRTLINLEKHLPVKLSCDVSVTIIYDQSGKCEKPVATWISLYLNPLEVKIFEFKIVKPLKEC